MERLNNLIGRVLVSEGLKKLRKNLFLKSGAIYYITRNVSVRILINIIRKNYFKLR